MVVSKDSDYDCETRIYAIVSVLELVPSSPWPGSGLVSNWHNVRFFLKSFLAFGPSEPGTMIEPKIPTILTGQ